MRSSNSGQIPLLHLVGPSASYTCNTFYFSSYYPHCIIFNYGLRNGILPVGLLLELQKTCSQTKLPLRLRLLFVWKINIIQLFLIYLHCNWLVFINVRHVTLMNSMLSLLQTSKFVIYYPTHYYPNIKLCKNL